VHGQVTLDFAPLAFRSARGRKGRSRRWSRERRPGRQDRCCDLDAVTDCLHDQLGFSPEECRSLVRDLKSGLELTLEGLL